MAATITLIVGALAVTLALAGCQAQRSSGPTTTVPAPALPVTIKAELLPPPQVPPPTARRVPATVQVELETVERTAAIAEGASYTFWTFGGTVPGPMLRVRSGDTVELTLKNAPASTMPHSIDLHAVTGPGGGAVYTQTAPGGRMSFRFKALNPGLYVYHCATPSVPEHVANGMYGLILVEPEAGLTPVEREYYVMQGDFYTRGKTGEPGHQAFSMEKMLAETPEYIVFNGSTQGLVGEKSLKARVGERVRIYAGAGGPNLTSSFHVIGEIFDRVHPEGASEAMTNVQTTRIPPGGAAIVEMKFEVPGSYILVDHALSRLLKGAAGYMEVEGEPAPALFGSMSGAPAPPAGH